MEAIKLKEMGLNDYFAVVGLPYESESDDDNYWIASLLFEAAFYSEKGKIDGMYAITADGEVIGFTSFQRVVENKEVILDYFTISSDFTGIGYGTKALEAIIDFVQNKWDIEEVTVPSVPAFSHIYDFFRKNGFVRTELGNLSLKLKYYYKNVDPRLLEIDVSDLKGLKFLDDLALKEKNY